MHVAAHLALLFKIILYQSFDKLVRKYMVLKTNCFILINDNEDQKIITFYSF